jgi:hypothetical protein
VSLAGLGVLAIWNGIADEAEADFVAWHVNEHIPERVGVPGFLRGRRYVALSGHPEYFNFYETETPATLTSRAYIERLNAPSDWTRQVVRHFKDTSRTVCSVTVSIGIGDGGFVATIRLKASAGADIQPQLLRSSVMEYLSKAPGIIGLHLLHGERTLGGEQTAEKALRDRPDETVSWLLLIEAVDSTALQAAISAHATPEILGTCGALYGPADLGIYQLQFALARAQLG